MLATTLIAAAISASAAVALAAPAAADITVDVPGIGTVSYGNDDGMTLRNYGYRFSAGSPTGSTRYSMSSSGGPDGVRSYQQFVGGSFQGHITQRYGTAYEGSTCILCHQHSLTGPTGTWGSETSVSTAEFETETTTPFGNFSLPLR